MKLFDGALLHAMLALAGVAFLEWASVWRVNEYFLCDCTFSHRVARLSVIIHLVGSCYW
jgi:hypothetical protein